jgi:hypothetical protein
MLLERGALKKFLSNLPCGLGYCIKVALGLFIMVINHDLCDLNIIRVFMCFKFKFQVKIKIFDLSIMKHKSGLLIKNDNYVSVTLKMS